MRMFLNVVGRMLHKPEVSELTKPASAMMANAHVTQRWLGACYTNRGWKKYTQVQMMANAHATQWWLGACYTNWRWEKYTQV
jgi:ribosomal protein S2